MGYNPRGHKELDMPECTCTHTHTPLTRKAEDSHMTRESQVSRTTLSAPAREATQGPRPSLKLSAAVQAGDFGLGAWLLFIPFIPDTGHHTWTWWGVAVSKD